MSHESLAERFRPKTWDDVIGQEKVLSHEHILHTSMLKQTPINVLLWGPPGTGKTSVARMYLRAFDKPWHDMHPSSFSAQKIKEVLHSASNTPLFRPTLFWIDEIHRLTSPQQDLLLKAMEDGTIVVIAATTENPSFCLRPPLLSRMHSLKFESLSEESSLKLLNKLLGKLELEVEEEAKHVLCQLASGDARKLLSLLEVVSLQQPLERPIGVSDLEKALHLDAPRGMGSHGEGRYLLISALHKAVRGSDCQAALYWFARLLEAHEDPVYIARRLIRMATEDIGLADPQALSIALRAYQAYQAMGSPEGDLALAETVVYLALSPKSAACYLAYEEARRVARESAHIPPPMHILNAPTKWMEKQGYADGYIWEHSQEDALSGQSFWPHGVESHTFYSPVQRGFERDLEQRLKYFEKMRERLRRKC